MSPRVVWTHRCAWHETQLGATYICDQVVVQREDAQAREDVNVGRDRVQRALLQAQHLQVLQARQLIGPRPREGLLVNGHERAANARVQLGEGGDAAHRRGEGGKPVVAELEMAQVGEVHEERRDLDGVVFG